jgi:hypothetical protein
MGEHASDGSPEDSGGRTVVYEGPARVGEETFPEELAEFDFISEERSGDIDALTSDDGDSLSWTSERSYH